MNACYGLVIVLLCQVVCAWGDGNVTVHWVRTAKDNGDRLTVQKTQTLGKDFNSNNTVSVNR